MQHPGGSPSAERAVLPQSATAKTDRQQTPWDHHLLQIYDGDADESEGLVFFGSRGYYDMEEEYSGVDAFCKRLGLNASWFDPKLPTDEEATAYFLRLDRQSDDTSQTHPTLWETHLQAVYDGDASDLDALAFFESHGYYDANEGRPTLAQLLVEQAGLESFWGKLGW